MDQVLGSGTASQAVNSAANYKNNIPCINPDKFSEEFAKDIKCISKINNKDEKNTDWQKNKKTAGKQLFMYPLNSETGKSNRELIIDF